MTDARKPPPRKVIRLDLAEGIEKRETAKAAATIRAARSARSYGE